MKSATCEKRHNPIDKNMDHLRKSDTEISHAPELWLCITLAGSKIDARYTIISSINYCCDSKKYDE